jgi:hypothetical protein
MDLNYHSKWGYPGLTVKQGLILNLILTVLFSLACVVWDVHRVLDAMFMMGLVCVFIWFSSTALQVLWWLFH